MRVRAWCMVLWGVLCGGMFVVMLVSKATSGDLLAYLVTAMVLTASILSVKTGRHQLAVSRTTAEPTDSVVA